MVDVKRATRSVWLADGRTTLAYTWPSNHRHRNASHASSRLRFPSPGAHSIVCQRTQARQKWESFRHVVCMPVCGVARQPQGGPGQGCLVSDIDCISVRSVRTARRTVHDCGSASRCPLDGLPLLYFCIYILIVANAHMSCNSLMTRLTLARAFPTVRCSSCP